MIDYQKLFNLQEKLDKNITEKHGLKGQDLTDKRILALIVEFGELTQEWRQFKFWKKDNQPNTEFYEWYTSSNEKRTSHKDPKKTYPFGIYKKYRKSNPLLEEYIDCLHFIMSLGNEISYKNTPLRDTLELKDVKIKTDERAFLTLNQTIAQFETKRNTETYNQLFNTFRKLGELLGFTSECVEKAYHSKNAINHDRQKDNY